MSKPILSIDFDGVIHSYISKWAGADVIPDPPVDGALQFLREAVQHFRVHVFSTRSHQEGGIEAMREWLAYWACVHRKSDDEDLAWLSKIRWPTTKPPALVMIDDRAFCFEGKWPEINELLSFKPWNKRGQP